ncbi:MAG: hypothetical protein HQ567_19015 [Candidatus Nealsonbacteria bacterium]|nr:hypothetical protein [Candidatus Nealsonbacteria bacterium]
MTQSDHVSPSPEGGWRGKEVAQSSTTTRWVNRTLFGTITLVLMGLLVWLIWLWYSPSKTHLVCLSVVEYDRLTVPTIPFGEEDLEQLKGVSLTEPKKQRHVLRDVAGLDGELDGIDTGRRDVLICYLSAHGVSQDGTAYLLCVDYDGQSKEKRYELGELLDRLRGCRAKRKLLILDVGHIASDPRLGMLANEFPRILEKKLKELDDRRLWVLTSNRPLQASHASFPAGRSIFGYYVTEGLKGAANRADDSDGNVGLAELYRYVRDGVGSWVEREVGGRQVQTPWLLQGGEGTVTNPPDDVLVCAAAEKSSKETPGGAGNGQEKPAALDETPPSVREFAKQAWELPERMTRQDDSWLPVDYAPHLWREYLEKLVHYESRYRGGKGINRAELDTGLQVVMANRDEKFWQEQSKCHVGFKGIPREKETTAKVRELVQLKNDLVFAAPYYLRWYARLSQASTSAETHPHDDAYDDVSGLLDKLSQFTKDLERLETAVADGESRSQMESILTGLVDGALQLRGPAKRLRDRLDREVEEMAEKPEKNSEFRVKRPGRACRIEALLGFPLLSRDQRIMLLDALDALKSTPPKTRALTDDDVNELNEEAKKFADWQRGLLVKQANLEKQLVMLAGSNEKIGLKQPGSKKEGFWEACRTFGKDLGTFYQGLPEEIHAARADGDFRRAERLLRLVDPRDAKKIHEAATVGSIVRDVRFPPPPGQPALTVTGSSKTPQLGPGKNEGEFQIEIVATDLSGQKAEITLDYYPDLLQVLTANGKTKIEPGQPEEITLEKNETIRKYSVVALADNRATRPPEVNVSVRAGNKTAPPCKVTFKLPAPDTVELQVYRVGREHGTLMTGTDPISLRPFPGRATEFRFDLQNLSEDKKDVTVQLLRLSTHRRSELPSPDRLVKKAGKWQLGVEELTAAESMTLPPKSGPEQVPFTEPKPAAPPDARAETEVDPQPDSGLCVWACVIHDKNDTDSAAPAWYYWLDFVPVDPRQYVQLESLPSYDPRQRAVNVHVGVRKTDARGRSNPSLPEISSKKPINVTWDTGPDVGFKTVRSKMLITSPDEPVEWPMTVDPLAPRELFLRLHVDGYPRVFAFRIEREQHGQVSKINRPGVRITSPEEGKAYRPDGPIPLAFQVDDPRGQLADWGGTVPHGADPPGYIQVRFVSQSRGVEPVKIEPFFGNRQVTVARPELTPTGMVKVRASVQDFRMDLQDDRLDDGKVRLEVALRLPSSGTREDLDPPRHSVEIFLDSKPPVCTGTVADGRILQGEPLLLGLQCEDLSGVEKIKMEVGIDQDGSGELEKGERLLSPPQPDARGWCLISLPTKIKGKLLPPGNYSILFQATDSAGNKSPVMEAKGVTIEPKPNEADQSRVGYGEKNQLEVDLAATGKTTPARIRLPKE